MAALTPRQAALQRSLHRPEEFHALSFPLSSQWQPIHGAAPGLRGQCRETFLPASVARRQTRTGDGGGGGAVAAAEAGVVMAVAVHGDDPGQSPTDRRGRLARLLGRSAGVSVIPASNNGRSPIDAERVASFLCRRRGAAARRPAITGVGHAAPAIISVPLYNCDADWRHFFPPFLRGSDNGR